MKKVNVFLGALICVVALGLYVFNALNDYGIKNNLNSAILAAGSSGSASGGGGTGAGSDEDLWKEVKLEVDTNASPPYTKDGKTCYDWTTEWIVMCLEDGGSPCLEGRYDARGTTCRKPL